MSLKDVIFYCEKTLTKTNKNIASAVKLIKDVMEQELQRKQITI